MSIGESSNSVIDGENKIISVPIGPITLHLNFDEWEPFVEMIMDIHSIFHSTTVTNHHQCESCGHIDKIVDYIEPEETEVN